MAQDKNTLAPIGRWDFIWRGSFERELNGTMLTVDVDYFDFAERIRLYRNGSLVETKESPARFVIDDSTNLEAALSLYGMKYVRLREKTSKKIRSLSPREGTAEAWRARLEQTRPRLSRTIAITSWAVIVFAFVTQLPVWYNSSIAHLTGSALPTFELPIWANVALSVVGVAAALDRALRMKHRSLLDE